MNLSDQFVYLLTTTSSATRRPAFAAGVPAEQHCDYGIAVGRGASSTVTRERTVRHHRPRPQFPYREDEESKPYRGGCR